MIKVKLRAVVVYEGAGKQGEVSPQPLYVNSDTVLTEENQDRWLDAVLGAQHQFEDDVIDAVEQTIDAVWSQAEVYPSDDFSDDCWRPKYHQVPTKMAPGDKLEHPLVVEQTPAGVVTHVKVTRSVKDYNAMDVQATVALVEQDHAQQETRVLHEVPTTVSLPKFDTTMAQKAAQAWAQKNALGREMHLHMARNFGKTMAVQSLDPFDSWSNWGKDDKTPPNGVPAVKASINPTLCSCAVPQHVSTIGADGKAAYPGDFITKLLQPSQAELRASLSTIQRSTRTFPFCQESATYASVCWQQTNQVVRAYFVCPTCLPKTRQHATSPLWGGMWYDYKPGSP